MNDGYVTFLGDATTDCAQQVKGGVYTGTALTVGGIGVGLFGTYKLLKKNWAAGVVSMIGASITWAIGRSMINSSAAAFESCRRTHGVLTPAMQLVKDRGLSSSTCSQLYSDPNGLFRCMQDHPGGQVSL